MVTSLCGALSPYPWRRLTPHMVARLVLAARDRHVVESVLAVVHGAEVGRWDVLEPVERTDIRVPPLVGFLDAHRWDELQLPTLCQALTGVLDEGPS
jgi:hypothetical protein